MRRHALIVTLLCSLVVHAATTNQKLERKIVASLHEELKQQLAAGNITHLLVLPGSNSVNITLKWGQLPGLQHVEFIRSFRDFSSHWHRASRPSLQGVNSHIPGLRGLRGLLQHLAGHSDDDLVQTPHLQHRNRVALLTLAQSGAIRSGQASLGAAILRRLRGATILTMVHSTHKDKPETLVTFDGSGEPVTVAVQESSVFRDRFTQIYANKVWSAAGGGSGDGSTLEYTSNIRRMLLDVLARYNISSMLDSSCGSMHWMPLVLQQRQQEQPGFKFMGTDVVCNLIEQHKVTFANETNWQFQCVDYSAQPLPSGYDLVWSRDSLQHVPLHGAWQFLSNVRASGAKYLLVGSYVKSSTPNVDIAGGDYYALDLLKPPFNVSKPLEILDEQTPDGKHMLLFDVQKMTWDDALLGLV